MLGLGLTKYIPFCLYVLYIAASPLALLKPVWALYILIPLIPFRNITLKLYQFPLGKDIVDIYALLFLLSFLFQKNKKINFEKIIIFYVVFQIFAFFVALLTTHANSYFLLRDLKNFLLLPFFYFITKKNINSKRSIYIMAMLLCIALLWADRTFIRYYLSRSSFSHFRWSLRDAGIFVDVGGSNELAAFYSNFFFIPFCLFFFEHNLFKKVFFLFLSSLTVFPILFCFSRGAYLGFGFGIVGITFLAKQNKKLSMVLLIALLIFTFNYKNLLPQAVLERIEMTENPETGELDSTTKGRLKLWQESLQKFIKSPLFGHGFDYIKITGLTGLQRGFGDPHNKYIETLVEGGIIGLFLFITLLLFFLKNSYRLYLHAKDNFLKGLGLAGVGTIISCAVTNFFGDRWTYLELGIFLWVLMALISNGNEIIKKQNNIKVKNINFKLNGKSKL